MGDTTVLIAVGITVAVLLLGLGVLNILSDVAAQRQTLSSARGDDLDVVGRTRWQLLSQRFAGTRPGKAIGRELELAGLHVPALTIAVVTAALAVVAPIILWRLVAPLVAIITALSAWFIVRWWLRRAQDRRRDAFVSQVPELARILSNATGAGLSISTAWQVAAEEMPEPAKTEVERIVSSVRFGKSLEGAMIDSMERIPAREVRVLMSTLVIASRSGGALVQALQDISLTLDARKEIRREVRTIFSQAVATGYTVIGMGALVLLGLNWFNPGLIRQMTESVLGQVGFVVAGLLFAFGLFLIRRITRVDL